MRRRNVNPSDKGGGNGPTNTPHTPTSDSSDESWDDILTSQTVVSSREEALESVVDGTAGLPKGFLLKNCKKFWLWHLPPIVKTSSAFGCLRAGMLFWTHHADSGTASPGSLVHTIGSQIFREMSSLLLGVSEDKSFVSNIVGVSGRFLITSASLIGFRIYQRLSWRTSELGTFSSVKEDERYQDEELLTKAWNKASEQGWPRDPVKCDDFAEGLGGGAVFMQPRPGFCGMATLNSTLRSFGGILAGGTAPYLKLHAYPRYVTLEEMVKLVKRVISGRVPHEKSIWESGGGNPIESMQVIGGGKNGFASLEQLKAALRQLSHPTQPARIMAIYHRSPLFFCSSGKTLQSKLSCFPMVHWSPVIAYLEDKDLVLVMDVNHLYGSKGYLLPTKRFYDSVNTRDCFNGNYHGLVLLRPPPPHPRAELPLLASARELSVEFGRIKKAYYMHQTAGRAISTSSILESQDDGYSPLTSNRNGEKAVRYVAGRTNEISAVVSAHPVAFTNEVFLDPGSIPSLDDARSLINVSTKLRVPARIAIRGYDSSTAKKVHAVLTAAGFVQLMKSVQVMFMNLEPSSTCVDIAKERLPSGFEIQEITHRPADGSHSMAVEQLGRLIATSYKMPDIERRGISTSDFYSQAYQTFNHGGEAGGLRHFACFHLESGEMASCVALFCNKNDTATGTRTNAAAIYNVCTSAKYRRKGLAETMTLVAMEEAKNIGCKQIILEASKEGKPLYEGMGFVSMAEDTGGMYVSLSCSTVNFKWRLLFRVFELCLRLKHGGLQYYYQANYSKET